MNILNDDFGLTFDYSNHRLSSSSMLDAMQMDLIGEEKGNDGKIFVRCKSCGQYMDYQDGKWICPSCGTKVKEQTAYNKLEKENEKGVNAFFDEPDACLICGGPWPDCQTSCKLYD